MCVEDLSKMLKGNSRGLVIKSLVSCTDGRGEPARTRRQSLEERGERDGRGWGEKERPNEAKRGDKRRYASEVSRRARGDAAGRGEGMGQRK